MWFYNGLFQVFGRSRCKLNYEILILALGALARKPWASAVVLQRLVQGSWAFQVQTSLQGANPGTQGASPETLGTGGGFTKACLRFLAFQVQT